MIDKQSRVTEDELHAYIDGELPVDRQDAEPLLSWLKKMRFRLRVDPRDASDELAIVGGTASAIGGLHAAAPAGVALVWHDPWPGVTVGGWAYGAADPHPGADRDWAEALIAPEEVERLARGAASGALRLSGSLAADALRIAAWRPRMSDADERLLPPMPAMPLLTILVATGAATYGLWLALFARDAARELAAIVRHRPLKDAQAD